MWGWAALLKVASGGEQRGAVPSAQDLSFPLSSCLRAAPGAAGFLGRAVLGFGRPPCLVLCGKGEEGSVQAALMAGVPSRLRGLVLQLWPCPRRPGLSRAEAPGIPQLPQKAGHGFSAPRASVAFFPARAEGRQLLRPGWLCWHCTVALCARGLSVGNRGGGCGGLLLVFPLQTIPVSGVGLSRSDVPWRYSSSKLPSCLRHWSVPASEHLESSPWADLESRTKEGKQLLKAACFSELLSENKTVRGAGALQAP